MSQEEILNAYLKNVLVSYALLGVSYAILWGTQKGIRNLGVSDSPVEGLGVCPDQADADKDSKFAI